MNAAESTLPSASQRASHAASLIEASLAAVNPADCVRRYLRRNQTRLQAGDRDYDLDKGRVFVVAAGKAARPMGKAAAQVLGDKLTAGILISKRPSQSSGDENAGQWRDGSAARLKLRYAGHPVPDQDGVAATAEVVEMLGKTTSDDLVLCLLSGGASALLTRPILPLRQWQGLVDALLASGCTINELNSVRKRLDQVKGGGLARLAAPAAVASLILSDVVGNPLDVIGSGPTVANPDAPDLAGSILKRYNVSERLPEADWTAVSGQPGPLATGELPAMADVNNVIIGDVRQAAQAATGAARQLGFNSQLLTAHLEGEAREVGRVIGALAKDAPPNSCLVLGGETTVSLRGDGLGGRNLEVALSAAMAIDGWHRRVVITFATDGDDGPTNAAGALVTGETVKRAQLLGLDAAQHLDINNSYPFFKATDSLLVTGQTGTNVNDLIFIMHYALD